MESAQSAAISRRYLHGPAVDQVLAEEDVTAAIGAAGRALWHLGDQLGSTRDLVDNLGALATHYKFDSFGSIKSGDTTKTRYLYTNQEYDVDTGNFLYNERWYDPILARFLSEDPNPAGTFADGLNNYAYVKNGPTGASDPMGWARNTKASFSWNGKIPKGRVTAECFDSFQEWAMRITGDQADADELLARYGETPIYRQTYDVSYMLERNIKRLSAAVVKTAHGFHPSAQFFDAGKLAKLPPAANPLVVKTNTQIDSITLAFFFGNYEPDATDGYDSLWADCGGAAHLIQAQALHQWLWQGEFAQLFKTYKGIPMKTDSADAKSVIPGSLGSMENDPRYSKLFPTGAWAREWVLAMGDGLFWGWTGRGVTMDNDDWRARLLERFNKAGEERTPPASTTIGQVPGWKRESRFFDVAAIAEKTWEARKPKH